VILTDTNREGGATALRRIRQAHPEARAEFRALDLADLGAIRNFAADLTADAAPLDLLVNNAGILPSLQRQQTRDGFELCFGIGHLGHFALTGLLLPALLRGAAPRVVGVSSLVQAYARIAFDDLHGERRYEPQQQYNQTKLAVLMFALELHEHARRNGWPLLSLAAHPGVARTALGDARMRERPRRVRDHLEAWAYRAMMRLFGQSPGRGAESVLHAATAPDAQGGEFYGPGGFQQFSGPPKRVAPSKAALDPQARARLWAVSGELTGVRYD
jgi:NAD(P)-dependent dehydrogenase (short-subunit alcohol dehydrogenase family)